MGRSISGWHMKLSQVSKSPAQVRASGAAGNGWPLLGYPLEHAPGLEDKGRKHHPAQVGSGTKLGDNVAEYWHQCKSGSPGQRKV
jgi:hypothetical protein